MKEEARQSKLLAFFTRLSGKDKDLVLKVTETIHKETKDNEGDNPKAKKSPKA